MAHNHTNTDGHGNSMTELAQWDRFGENKTNPTSKLSIYYASPYRVIQCKNKETKGQGQKVPFL